MIFIYFRYSRFRISTASEIKNLQNKNEQQAQELKDTDHKLLQATKTDNDKIQSLLTEIDELRKEKENEVKLRLNAEKQIELTMQKVEELQKRIDDWRVMQDAVMRDSKDAMFKIGNDLFRKLNDSYKQEVETNKNLIGRVSKTVSEFFDKFSVGQQTQKKPANLSESASENHHEEQHHVADDTTKKLISDLVEIMKAGGHMVSKNYFMPANFDEQKAKLMLCEMAFVASGKLHIFDFKACRYLVEYNQLAAKNKVMAQNTLKQKLDKYLAYLSNPKYRDSIVKVMKASRAQFEKDAITIVVPSIADLQIIKEIRYYEKARKLGLDVLEFDEVNNIVL